MSWRDLSEWWLAEVDGDTAYEEVVTPLLLEVLDPKSDHTYLDLGVGEGRVMRAVRRQGAESHGIDLSEALARAAGDSVVGELPAIPMRSDTYDGVYCVLTLEHIEDHAGFFAEAARVTRARGVLALVINHPVWTAPDSTPITDEDGEVLWRSGSYFATGMSQIPAGDVTVTFHHRPMGALLTAAAAGNWCLERMIEQPHHELSDQSGIPRLLACRWRLGPAAPSTPDA